MHCVIDVTRKRLEDLPDFPHSCPTTTLLLSKLALWLSEAGVISRWHAMVLTPFSRGNRKATDAPIERGLIVGQSGDDTGESSLVASSAASSASLQAVCC